MKNYSKILALPGTAGGFTAKSLIIDIANNWGESFAMSLRQLDMYLEASKVTMGPSLGSFYNTSQQNTIRVAKNVFDTSTSYTGGTDNNGWMGDYIKITNQRVSAVFNDLVSFDGLTVNNGHWAGASSNRGAKNVKIYISPNVITDTTYGGSLGTATLIFDGQFTQHPAIDIRYDQILTLL